MAVIAFSRAASEWEAAHLFAARALKNLDPIPEDLPTKPTGHDRLHPESGGRGRMRSSSLLFADFHPTAETG